MVFSVVFSDERLELQIPDDQVVASWMGPPAIGRDAESAAVRRALEDPLEFPPLRQMIVPGDRVGIAFDPTVPRSPVVLDELTRVVTDCGVALTDITVVVPTSDRVSFENLIRPEINRVIHDPDDRTQLAYLAATKQGRRVYLNRVLTDADVVIPVARLGFDPILGYRGPWSVIFPELSERATLNTHHARFRDEPEHLRTVRASVGLDESSEVSWLLGSQFHVGIVPGSDGLEAVVAGRESAVRTQGIAAVNSVWTFSAPTRAELVVIGIGQPGQPGTIRDLGAGLALACSLVQRGGKIVVLSRVQGAFGRAVSCLVELDEPKNRSTALRGQESAEDYVTARQVAHALAWADLFVLSDLGTEKVEDLAMVALETPEQARRLIAKGRSCTFVSHAELSRATVCDEDKVKQDDDSR